jgi:two-component system sensor histidine kinase BaeS
LKTSMMRRLSVRIGLLIVILGPTLLVAALLLSVLSARLNNASANVTLFELPVIGVGISLILGLIAAKFVSAPLSDLSQAILALQQSNYQIRLKKDGVAEFDGVIDGFNQLVDRLAEEEDLRKNLISDTSHELRTPTAALYAQLQGLKDGILILDADRLQLLLGQTERLTELIDRLQQYASIRSAAAKPTIESVTLSEIITKVSQVFAHDLHTANMHIVSQGMPDATIQADAVFLEQIVSNLIENAIKYSSGTVIYIDLEQHFLSISDNGRGVAEQHLPHLFERFYRVESSRNRQSGGLGLGLAIVKELIEAQGWQIEVTQNPGLCFRIDLG